MQEDYYKILGVAKTASGGDIRKAYLKLARDNHPDRFKDPAEREEADRRFQLITEAYNQLREEKSRAQYDKTLDRPSRTPEEEASLFYKNAKLQEEARDWSTALKYYYEAMRIKPDELEYMLRAANILSMDKSKQRQAAQLYERAMEAHPDSPEPHLALGALYARSGMQVRAKRVYESALKKMPHHPELKKRLAALK